MEAHCIRCKKSVEIQFRKYVDRSVWMQTPPGWWRRTDTLDPVEHAEWLCDECIGYLDSDENA